MSYADAPKFDARIAIWLAAGLPLLGLLLLLPLPSKPTTIVHTPKNPDEVAACLVGEPEGKLPHMAASADADWHGMAIETLGDGGIRVLVRNGRRAILQTLTVLPEGTGSLVEDRSKGGILGTDTWKRCAPSGP
ncbi:hypothetical protein IAG41_14000 [Sphingomonas sp. JC676]|uniref:hypothetical protein n=1 Tax=Sphingomonas sp. JC676 TaxID=2768065 RepID=UPI001657F952|nr:hypothetical protein [Sphingomonas sp. JC676]MBC9033505.1 hypothetical protein [Sphingomonas sp. JC676]